MDSIITLISPWTFLYGFVFALFSALVGSLRGWVGYIALAVAFLILKDLPGTLLATSLYLLFQLKPWSKIK